MTAGLTILCLSCATEESPISTQPEHTGPQILAAYHGLDDLPAQVSLVCPTMVGGTDGMPVVFSVQIDLDSVSESAFIVEKSTGERVTPLCATLVPAIEPLERRTVLLAGDFGATGTSPRAVEVVGPLRDVNGQTLTGLRTEDVTPLSAGPELVLAERFDPDTPGLAGECPPETVQVVQVTWNGGVHGVGHVDLGEPQILGTTVTLTDGRQVNPIALADDDPDNHVHVCLDAESPALSVTIMADLFEDPGGDPNPETVVEVQPGAP